MKLLDYTYGFHAGTNGRTLLLLHGVGGDENDMAQVGRLLDADASQLRPKGKVTVDGHVRYFTRRADASFDPSEVDHETADLVGFTNAANTEHGLSDTQLVAIGYSNGANMIASLLAKQPGLIKKAVLFRGMLPVAFSEHPDLTGVDILLLNGEADHIMDKTRVTQLRDYLADCDASVTLHWTKAGHQLSPQDISIASEWLSS